MKSIVIASVLLLGVFGCGVSSDTRDDVDESSEPAVSESTAESALVCQRWFCEAEKPGTDCQGFGIALSEGRCRADALSNCRATCGGPCVIVSATCDFETLRE